MSRAWDSSSRLAPVGEQYRHVGEHVAEGAQLPVQNGPHLPVDAHDAVVQPVVAVHDAGGVLRGDARRQVVVNGADLGVVGGAGGLHLPQPAPQLAGHVALPPSQVAESGGVDVDAVQPGQHVGERAAERLARPGRQGRRRGGVADHDAVDVLHDVEGGAVHAGVGAQPQRLRHGETLGVQAGDRPVLAPHVVCGGQHVVQRGAAQHPAPPAGVADDERHVGVPGLHERERQGWGSRGQVLSEPGRDGVGVDAFGRRGGVGVMAHGLPVTLPPGRAVVPQVPVAPFVIPTESLPRRGWGAAVLHPRTGEESSQPGTPPPPSGRFPFPSFRRRACPGLRSGARNPLVQPSRSRPPRPGGRLLQA